MNGWALAADIVVLVHFAFVLFVPFGGLLALRWPRGAFVHLPAALYGAAIELVGWVCPLTPLENDLRRAAGEAGYEGGFIAHYLLPILYPVGLTRGAQLALAALVVGVNVVVYGVVVWRWRRRGRAGRG